MPFSFKTVFLALEKNLQAARVVTKDVPTFKIKPTENKFCTRDFFILFNLFIIIF